MNAMALLEAKKNMAHTIASARSLPGHRNFELPRHSDPGPASASSSHDFGQVAINPPPIATGACPLSLASSRACPFGGACHTCPTRIQTKLTINEPGDEYEQEADRVAEQVMRMREPPKQEVAPTSKKPLDQTIRRKCAQCDEREALLQTKESPGQAGESAHSLEVPPSVHGVLHSPGQPLYPATRAFMEPRFGCDFSRVRVHTDAKAVESANAVSALAYTVGREVVFGAGQYAPGTTAGRQLLAHELTHVAHQAATPRECLQRQIVTPLGQGGGFGGLMERERRRAMSTSATAAATQSKSYPFNVTTDGCDKKPYVKADVVAAVKAAYQKVLTSNCVRSEALKDEILSEFNGLNIDCEQDGKGCGMASRYFTQTVNIYPKALNAASCGPLASTILHEIVHLTEWRLFGHGELADACEKACFGYGSGDASKCK
jgi:hypothetical protein